MPRKKFTKEHYVKLINDPHFIKETAEIIRVTGKTYMFLLEEAKKARIENRFNYVNYKKLPIGKKTVLFEYQSEGRNHDFWVMRQKDGSPVTSADIIGYNTLKEYSQSVLPQAAALFEENDRIENMHEIQRRNDLAHRGVIVPTLAVDDLDNTRGYLLRIMGKKGKEYHNSHLEFSINYGISFSDGTPGVGFIYMPGDDRMFFSYDQGAFVIHNMSSMPRPRPQKLLASADDAVGHELIVVTSNTDRQLYENSKAGGLEKSKVQMFLEGMGYMPNQFNIQGGTGMARVSMLLLGNTTPRVHLARTGNGTHFWDASAAIEICKKQGLAFGVKQENVAKFNLAMKRSTQLPEYYIGLPGILTELGLRIVVHPEYKAVPEITDTVRSSERRLLERIAGREGYKFGNFR